MSSMRSTSRNRRESQRCGLRSSVERATLIGVGVLSWACTDAPTTPRDPRDVPAPLTAAEAAMRKFGRDVAAALAVPEVRASVRDAMRASPWDEHKVVLQEFVATSAGAPLLSWIARGRRSSLDALRAEIRAMPPMDFYMPAREHRRTWQGEAGARVVATLDVHGALIAYDALGRGTRIASRADALTAPTFLIQPAEWKGRRVNAPSLVAALVIEDANDNSGSEMHVWRSGTDSLVVDMALPDAQSRLRALVNRVARSTRALTSSATANCDPTIQVCDCSLNPEMPECQPGGGGGTAPPDTTIINYFKMNFCDDDPCWTNLEIRFRSTHFDLDGNTIAYHEYWRGSINPEDEYTPFHPFIFSRIGRFSGHRIRTHLIEEDRNEPFGVNRDDDCGTIDITFSDNMVMRDFPVMGAGCGLRDSLGNWMPSARARWHWTVP